MKVGSMDEREAKKPGELGGALRKGACLWAAGKWELAQKVDVPRIMEIISQAQAQLKASGSTQWQNAYPAVADIEQDILKGIGYTFEWENCLVAYGAVCTYEEAYEQPSVKWQFAEPYVVVHRLAVAEEMKQKGLATELMYRVAEWAYAKGFSSFRIDTHQKNSPMQKLLVGMGFVYCGDVFYVGGHRMAYEKSLKFEPRAGEVVSEEGKVDTRRI